MTIQPSVLVWTVINFCLFMLVIWKLLFKPMLAFMDGRQEKIDKAAKKKADNERLIAESNEKLRKYNEDAAHEKALLIQKEIEKIHLSASEQIETAYNDRFSEIEKYKMELDIENREISDTVSNNTKRLSDLFVEKLTVK